MKKVIILCICICLLSACAVNNAGNGNLNTVAESVVTGSSITGSAVSGGAVSAAAVSEEVTTEKKKTEFVIDETGKKRKLNLGKIKTEDAGISLSIFVSRPVGLYSQVSDGHYYYLKSDGNHKYTIYRDKGEKVGQFSFDLDSKAYYNSVDYLVKYGSEFYAQLYYEYGEEDDYAAVVDSKTYLARVDLKKGKAEPIVELTDRSYGNLYLYQKELYFEDQSTIDDDIDWSECEWYDFPGTFVKMDMERNFSETVIPSTNHLDRQLGCLTFMDGKIYYGVQKGKKVTLYSYDLKSKKEEKILFYERKKAYHKYMSEMCNTRVEIDEDYIYCQDYIIPRDGGEMIPLFRHARVFEVVGDYGKITCAYNKKYIFYIDKDYKVHRFTKKTKQDVIISDMKAMDVKCTEDSVYVQEYDEYLTGDGDEEYVYPDDDPASGNVYYMDVNGEHVEKIVERVAPEIDNS